MVFQLISMGIIALRYEQIDVKVRSRNKLNSYLELPLYNIVSLKGRHGILVIAFRKDLVENIN